MNNIAEEYKKFKEEYPREILLFQVGIFYRIMFEDAKKIHEILALQLRVEGDAENPVFFCGFPKSGLDKYIGKLVRAGFSAVICSQTKSETGEIKRVISETIKCSKI